MLFNHGGEQVLLLLISKLTGTSFGELLPLSTRNNGHIATLCALQESVVVEFVRGVHYSNRSLRIPRSLTRTGEPVIYKSSSKSARVFVSKADLEQHVEVAHTSLRTGHVGPTHRSCSRDPHHNDSKEELGEQSGEAHYERRVFGCDKQGERCRAQMV